MEAMDSSSRAAMVDTDRTREVTDSRVDMEAEVGLIFTKCKVSNCLLTFIPQLVPSK